MSSPVLMMKLAVFTKEATGAHSFSVKATASGQVEHSDVVVPMLGSAEDCVPEFGCRCHKGTPGNVDSIELPPGGKRRGGRGGGEGRGGEP